MFLQEKDNVKGNKVIRAGKQNTRTSGIEKNRAVSSKET